MPKRAKKPKTIPYREVPRSEREPYALLEEIMAAHHEPLVEAEAKIALAWKDEYKPDADRHVTLGMCVKVGALQKEFSKYDFIIVLNEAVWKSADFTEEKKTALMDHELCHAAVCYDRKTGEMKRDARGRAVFRIRMHDIEEFHGIVERHGCYKGDLEAFAEKLLRRAATPLLTAAEDAEKKNGAQPPSTALGTGSGRTTQDEDAPNRRLHTMPRRNKAAAVEARG